MHSVPSIRSSCNTSRWSEDRGCSMFLVSGVFRCCFYRSKMRLWVNLSRGFAFRSGSKSLTQQIRREILFSIHQSVHSFHDKLGVILDGIKLERGVVGLERRACCGENQVRNSKWRGGWTSDLEDRCSRVSDPGFHFKGLPDQSMGKYVLCDQVRQVKDTQSYCSATGRTEFSNRDSIH